MTTPGSILGSRRRPETNSRRRVGAALRVRARGTSPPAMLLTDISLAFNARKITAEMGTFERRRARWVTLPVASQRRHPQTCGEQDRDWQPLHPLA